LSRIAILLVLLTSPAAAQEAVTADQVIENHQQNLKRALQTDCRPDPDPNIITVCGRRNDASRYRLPLPVEPEPGRRIRGEAVSAVKLAEKQSTCTPEGRNPKCGSIPLSAIALMVAKTAIKVLQRTVLDPED
jgi:hypothetical protein